MSGRDRTTVVLGCVAVIAWVLIFAAGILIDSEPFRKRVVTNHLVTDAATGATPLSPAVEARLDWSAFGASVLFYTPLNAALLTLLAGFVGGCASRTTYGVQTSEIGSATDDRSRQHLLFLTERPSASMLRSFVVYLGLIAGLYIAGSNPFEVTTASQYVRFAGTASLLAFAVGYDPTRLQEFLGAVPRPGGKGS